MRGAGCGVRDKKQAHDARLTAQGKEQFVIRHSSIPACPGWGVRLKLKDTVLSPAILLDFVDSTKKTGT
jgi:hypothetical protein